MGLLQNSYTVTTTITPREALDRVGSLLAREHVTYKPADSSIASTRTPVPLFNFDPRLYTRRNWVGMNPFAYITSLTVDAVTAGTGSALTIRVDRSRAVILMVMPVGGAVLAFWFASFIPAVIVCGLTGGLAWFYVHYVASSLLLDEIAAVVRSPQGIQDR